MESRIEKCLQRLAELEQAFCLRKEEREARDDRLAEIEAKYDTALTEIKALTERCDAFEEKLKLIEKSNITIL